jgi:hypothetical protein
MHISLVKSTVVIPNYNGIKYIEACLESLYGGTNTDMEVIVVDNGSSDGSVELVREKFPRVRLILNDKNTGFSHAVNQGIRECTTPYVILLNNDTRVGLTFIREMEKLMDNDKAGKIFSASAKLVSLYDKDRIDDAGDCYCALGWAFARGKGKKPDKYDRDSDIFSSCAGAAIYRRELLDEESVGLFDEEHFAYLEDIDLCYRARIMGYTNKFASQAIVYHAGSATSGSRYNTFKTKLASRNSIYIIYKNMPPVQLILNLPFLVVGFGVKTIFFARKGMGKEYVKGLADGFRLSKSENGKSHKVGFRASRILNYIKIQLLLWANLFRLIE